jgi:segregation and condensation protein B
MVEAMLFASAEPLGVAEMEARMPHGCDPAEALQLLRKRYEGRGVQVTRVGEGWAIRTAADLGFLMAREVVETAQAVPRGDRDAGDHRLSPAGDPRRDRGDPRRLGQPGHGGPADRAGLGPVRAAADDGGAPVTFVVTQGFLDHFGLETRATCRA